MPALPSRGSDVSSVPQRRWQWLVVENPVLVSLDWESHVELFNQPSPPPSPASSRFLGGLYSHLPGGLYSHLLGGLYSPLKHRQGERVIPQALAREGEGSFQLRSHRQELGLRKLGDQASGKESGKFNGARRDVAAATRCRLVFRTERWWKISVSWHPRAKDDPFCLSWPGPADPGGCGAVG